MFRKNFLSMVLLLGVLISPSVPPAQAATYCDHAQFVSDLTIPDGSSFAPGATFTKTWRLMNIGTCAWTTSYNLVWVGGEVLGAPLSVKLPADVPPGQTVDVSVNLTAPATPANYRGFFKLSNTAGVQFGIGDSASNPIWVDINVVSVSAVIYDFVANAPYAQWKSGAGLLPFPGTSGDSRGFAYQVNNPHLEDDSLDTAPGLLTVPQNKFNGYIQATYPEFQVQQGDRLQTLVNCEFGATNCYVTFRIDYLLPNGAQRTLWSWKEAYDNRFYRADLDLSSLAGQKVRFVFMLLSSGFARSDRAIWGSPRIMRTGITQPPGPPATLTPLPPLPPTPTPLGQPAPTFDPSGCDRATFVTDVTVPDGTVFSPGAAFTKTWRLKNAGSCQWTTSYKLIYYSGEQMGTSTAVNLPWNVPFDGTVDVSVNLVAPSTAGKYRGFWILSNANGQFFGIGTGARDPIWVEINVAGEAPIGTGYDFTSNVCSAQWRSTVGVLPCPGTDGNTNGFVIKLDAPKLEDGTTGAPGLLTVPQNRFNGYIQGFYPTFTVQPGDRFQATVGCEFGAACSLTYRLDYMAANGYIGTFWQWREQNEGKVYNANIDLSPLAGRSVRFILTILATGSATNDRALWGSPRISRAGGGPTPATITPVPPTDNWPLYTNATYSFQFKYPPGSERFFETTNNILIRMPIVPGTNLREKYLQMTVRENVNPCQSPLSEISPPGSPTETVVINGISFLKQTGGDAGVGHLREWVGYSTLKNNACISMDFVLHSLHAIDPPPPDFDKAAESAVFPLVMSTFTFAAPAPTPTSTATSAPATATPTKGAPPPVVSSPLIRKLFMIDASTGWALGNSYVLRTSDGGVTWYNVSMANVSSVANGFFRDANKGWVIATTFTDIERTYLFRTVNGGTTWTQYNVPFNGGYIQFLDDANGFVLSGEPSGMQRHAVSLYQTSDGGATWALRYANDPSQPNNSLPFSGHKLGMAFRDTATGWVGGDYPSPGYVYLYKTTNSGATWSQQSLALPVGYESAYLTIEAPKFFGTNDAILPVWMGTNTGRDLFIYVSHDGGTSWTLSPSVVPQGRNTDFVSINDGFAWSLTGFFKVTHNSGNNWTDVTPNVNFGDNLPFMDFVSTTTGWVIQNPVNGTTPLYRTNDGGATWTLISGTAAAPAPTPTPTTPTGPSPSEFAQTIVNTLNARNFNALPAMMDQTFSFAYWQSQGNSYPSDQAIESLRTGLTVTLIPNASMDLNSLLGGLNPYSIMGLDPSRSHALFVSGWGSDSNAEAILYVTQRADGSLYWHSVLVAPGGFARFAPTPTPAIPDAVSHDAFCADTRIPILIEQLKGSMNQSNGDMFAALASPTHGIDVRLWAYQPAVNFSDTRARDVFTSSEVYNWGAGPRGEPDFGTFKDVIQPKLQEVLNAPNMETYCDSLTKVYPLANPWPYPNIRYYNLYKPGTPGTELDFRTWLIGFEYINNQPYLHSMVTIVWEP